MVDDEERHLGRAQRAARAGAWETPCSQLCGLGHYRMRGFYTIDTEAECQAWLAKEAALLAVP